jgi:hypothetical protein
MNFELGDLCKSSVRPPVPEIPRAELLERERQGIFHSHRSGEVPHANLPDSGPVAQDDICVLDERGGHRKLGRNCPHGLIGADFDTVTDVLF